jgi:hypothetical protein
LIWISIRFKSDTGGWVATDCGRQKLGCLGMTKGKHRKPAGCHGVFPPCPTEIVQPTPPQIFSKPRGM